MRPVALWFLLVTFFILVWLPRAWAQPQKDFSGISQRLDRLIQKLDSAQKQAQEILSAQDQVIQEIENLKIWTRRG